MPKLFNNVVFKRSFMFLSKVIKRLVPGIQNYIDAALKRSIDPAEEHEYLKTLLDFGDRIKELEKETDAMPTEQGKKKMLYKI